MTRPITYTPKWVWFTAYGLCGAIIVIAAVLALGAV